MAQYIYLIAAFFAMMTFLMTSQRGIGRTEQTQSLTEVSTQLTGVGTELLEQIGRSYYDRHTYVQRATKPYCGRVQESQPNLFADTGSFSTTSRRWIEGYHGLDTTITRGAFPYRARVEVRYVPDGGAVATGTFSKEVVVRVTNPDLYIGDDPTNAITVTMQRVFTYGCATDPNYVPYYSTTSTTACPTTPPPCASSHGS